MQRIYKSLMAKLFSIIFQLLSIALIVFACFQFFQEMLFQDDTFNSAMITAINTFIIALAMFELGAGISKEFNIEDKQEKFYANIRRTITRFVGTVCIALVLEALIMIIKYSQLELAGNLWYPVGILVGSSSLLIALGLFLRLSEDVESRPKDAFSAS